MGGYGRSRRGRWWVVVAVVAGGLSALTVVLVLAAPHQAIRLIPTNLSKNPSLKSLVADVGVSPDGDRVAVVWVEEIAGVDRPLGSVWLRWALVDEASWRVKESVFGGSPQECAVEAAVAVTGTTAHVVYSVQSPCADDTEQTVIFYTTCLLTTGGCEAAQTIFSASSDFGVPRLSSMDIALDGGGVPHLVYMYRLSDDAGSPVTIIHHEGVSEPEEVPGSIGHNFNPAIAWSDGEVHVVWEDGEYFRIMYNRKTGTEWNPSATSLSGKGEDSDHHPRNPDIAAHEGYAVVTWDWQWDLPGLELDPYIVAYTRYLSDTHTWTPVFEVGTQGGAVYPVVAGDFIYPGYTPAYTYTSSPASQYPTSLRYLRPSVTLNKLGMPAVAWHAEGSDYDIQYSRALSMVETSSWGSAYHWSEPAVLNRWSSGDTGVPVMARAPIVSPTLHVVYLRRDIQNDWETYYEGRKPGFPLDKDDYPYAVFLPLLTRNYVGMD